MADSIDGSNNDASTPSATPPARRTSVSALKSVFSGGGNTPSTSTAATPTEATSDSAKATRIKSEITGQRRLSVKDMANKFSDQSTLNQEQRKETAELHTSSLQAKTSTKLIDELMGIERVSVRAIAEGFKGESTSESRELFLERQRQELESRKAARRALVVPVAVNEVSDEPSENEDNAVTFSEASMMNTGSMKEQTPMKVQSLSREIEAESLSVEPLRIDCPRPEEETEVVSIFQPSDSTAAAAPAVSARVSSASPKPMKINKSTPSPLPLQAETPIITQEQSSEVDSAKVSDAAADTVADSELIVLFDDILSRLTMSAASLADFGSEEFLDRILSIIESNFDRVEIVSRGLNILRWMCRFDDDVRHENAENVTTLGKLGACHVLINCLKTHGYQDHKLAEIGMCAVRNIASANAANIKLFGDLGACDLAQLLLQAHGRSHPNTAKACLGGIANLCFLNPNNRSALGKAGACSTVIEMLKLHAYQDVTFAKLGLASIINLAGTSGNKNLFGEADACDTVLKLVMYYTKPESINTDVPLHGSWAMLSLIDNSPKNIMTFKTLKAKEILTMCILNNREITSKSVIAKATEVVTKLSD